MEKGRSFLFLLGVLAGDPLEIKFYTGDESWPVIEGIPFAPEEVPEITEWTVLPCPYALRISRIDPYSGPLPL